MTYLNILQSIDRNCKGENNLISLCDENMLTFNQVSEQTS